MILAGTVRPRIPSISCETPQPHMHPLKCPITGDCARPTHDSEDMGLPVAFLTLTGSLGVRNTAEQPVTERIPVRAGCDC